MTPPPSGTPAQPSYPSPLTPQERGPASVVVPQTPGAAAQPAQPRWARPALLALLLVTAVLYLWSLSASGYANQFYSAAVQAGSESWKAFFFGSSDAANSITVDKPPAALWPMAPVSYTQMCIRDRLVGDPGARGADGGRDRRGAPRGRTASVRRGGGAAGRRGAGRHAGRGADVPVQQSRCAAVSADGLCDRRRAAGPGRRPYEVAGAGRCLLRPGLSDQDAPGVADPAGARRGLRLLCAGGAAPAVRSAAGRRPGDRGVRRLVGGDRRAVARVLASVHRRLAAQQLPGADLRLQRLRTDHR